MVVVDNIGAFYFRDRVTESMVGNGTTLQLYALKVVLLKSMHAFMASKFS